MCNRHACFTESFLGDFKLWFGFVVRKKLLKSHRTTKSSTIAPFGLNFKHQEGKKLENVIILRYEKWILWIHFLRNPRLLLTA